ncbi:hypothetical protein JKP88DRAFT_244900 [Tribonema minus]|uniref:Uncharacterized protein n=1 Tax=Tribonema minus TaxID=303371 RepID=A0A836CEZ4_9STRA|nr:hypothetical protein JKP88DRAFT_244900 [Tribonema minus]
MDAKMSAAAASVHERVNSSPLAASETSSRSRLAGMSTRTSTGPTNLLAMNDCRSRLFEARFQATFADPGPYLTASWTPEAAREMQLRHRFENACVTFRFSDTSRYFPYFDAANVSGCLKGILFRCEAFTQFQLVLYVDVEATRSLFAAILPGQRMMRIKGIFPCSKTQVHAKKNDTTSSSWNWNEKGPVAYMRTVTESHQSNDIFYYVHMRVERTGMPRGFDVAIRVIFTIEIVKRVKVKGATATEIIWRVEAPTNMQEMPVIALDT